jgi:hypothetical protein
MQKWTEMGNPGGLNALVPTCQMGRLAPDGPEIRAYTAHLKSP